MRSFWIRTTSLLLLVSAVLGYNGVLQLRTYEAEIEELTIKVDAYRQWEQEVRTMVENQDSEDVTPSEDNSIPDGNYRGSAQGYGGPIEVSVTIASGKIQDIQIISATGEDSAYLNTAKKITQNICKSQSTNVDTISGATFSSIGILNAVTDALTR